MEKQSIGKFIAILRKAKGMTQQQLAEKCNISNKTVSKWETEETLPDIELIAVLAEIFEVTCDELLRGRKQNIQPASEASSLAQPLKEKQLMRAAHGMKTRIKIGSVSSVMAIVLAAVLFLVLMMAYFTLAAYITAIVLTAAAVTVQCITIVSILQKVNFVASEYESDGAINEIVNECKRMLYNYSFCFFAALVVVLFVLIGGAL